MAYGRDAHVCGELTIERWRDLSLDRSESSSANDHEIKRMHGSLTFTWVQL